MSKSKIKWNEMDVPIEHAGHAITLPGDPGKMPITEAIAALQRRQKADDQIVRVREIIDGYPHDAMIAFLRAMQKEYGWYDSVPPEGFFGPEPVDYIPVQTGPGRDDIMSVPVGSFRLPGVSAPLVTQPKFSGNPALMIGGEFRAADAGVVRRLAATTRMILASSSIYRGHALHMPVDSDGDLLMTPPTFLDVHDTTESSLIFDASTTESIRQNVLNIIRHTARARCEGIPLHRGVLLEGSYGTGKSLTARMIAHECETNGWTFLLIDRPEALAATLDFAQLFQPAVVFCEDIDRVASVRDQKCNDLINVISGVRSTTSEVMLILSTNYAERLVPVLLRPGRLDAVISLAPPDATTATRLVRYYAGNALSAGSDLTEVGIALAGQIPAAIRECVERAKLGMIGRDDVTISATDLLVSAQSMTAHMALIGRQLAVTKESKAEILARTLRAVIQGDPTKMDGDEGKTLELIPAISRRTRQILEAVEG